ncbi:unnamed protein product [Gongylonema pulchrum]|uniref:DUF2336 domain-containing protein n=1 Tax=Gongylonema pulchrum TaxID=637853 RepID=A0A183DHK1_9BILA|nr:unnamed protein product [Gongylonema pulchrum]
MTASWVSDQLHTLLGCSDHTTVQYILALARKSVDADELLDRFRSTEAMKDTPEVRRFASELMAQVPHAGKLVFAHPIRTDLI